MQNLASQWEHVLSVKGLFDIITLSFLELILGIDNIIFISIAVEKLPKSLQHRTRVFGLTLALIVRTIML
ncbi:MAG: TerC family protein, partial [Bacteroidia bacterium]